jgi:hypothetical protein
MRTKRRQPSEFHEYKREKVTTMKKSKTIFSLVALAALALFALNSCKSDTVSEPSPTGPSSIGVILTLTASPNVISAGDTRDTAEITATLKKYDGIPLAGQTIFLKIKSSLGFFEDKLDILVKTTDTNGTVRATYNGPLRSEIGKAGVTIYIEATVSWEGSQFISDSTPIVVVRTDD